MNWDTTRFNIQGNNSLHASVKKYIGLEAVPQFQLGVLSFLLKELGQYVYMVCVNIYAYVCV